MKQLYKLLKSLDNIYIILLLWSLTTINLYFLAKPLNDYTISASLTTIPTVLDTMTYYTADEGYQVLSNLGEGGRNAYRLVNYVDFVFPFLMFLSISSSNIAFGKGRYYLIAPLVCMVFDYLENIAERYVLEIFPERNDFVMNLACYFGLVKMSAVIVSGSLFTFNVLQWFWRRRNYPLEKQQQQKSQ
ncbi:unnamed protein product [Adineta ricciae]|uniref:Uncharacterized protein n=1 Tax=Adineta ricciae TaxID=249248 RepID=A0A816EAQ3_ADIRI|nr:unnamed protein product [Adineta ricciae]